MRLVSVSYELSGGKILKLDGFKSQLNICLLPGSSIIFFLSPSDENQVNLSHRESTVAASAQIIALFADGCCLLMSPVPLCCKLRASLVCGHNSSDAWRVYDGLFGEKKEKERLINCSVHSVKCVLATGWDKKNRILSANVAMRRSL